ncbi:mechanosensitive ion channel family protein [Caldivirga sp. UBA161]|uniref:mechanosensitive ion channel family protein n=1 Tax=Caldivirga sp. UBA161 TaxID=1915569 RepID=UPI0025C617E0|nr:mechanosensitive ion channel family protein [Caldivirga sp. UBA161]
MKASSNQVKQGPPLSSVLSKIVKSWIPIIIAGIVVYIIYHLTIYTFNVFPQLAYLRNYEYLIRLSLVLIIGSVLILTTSREITKALYPYDPHTATALKFILQLLIALAVIIFVTASIVQYSPAAAALSGTIIGLVLGLAFQQTLNDVISGLVLLISKPFRPGERITFLTWRYGLLRTTYPTEGIPNGFTGTIVDMGLMYTTIVLDNGEVAKVPNSVLKDSMIINQSDVKYRVVRVRLDLPVKIPISEFENALRELLINDSVKGIKVLAEETWQQLETYQVAIVAYGDSSVSKEELKSLVLEKAIEVRSKLSQQKLNR